MSYPPRLDYPTLLHIHLGSILGSRTLSDDPRGLEDPYVPLSLNENQGRPAARRFRLILRPGREARSHPRSKTLRPTHHPLPKDKGEAGKFRTEKRPGVGGTDTLT